MSEVLDRIEAWQSAGLIDATTADRLRAAEAQATSPGEPTPTSAAAAPPRAGAVSAASSFFGPTPTIVEVFAYLGAGFFIGAWAAFLARIGGFDNRDVVVAVGSAVLVAILVAAGLVLRRGDDRRRRGAGVALLIATSAAGIAATSFAQAVHVDYGPPTQILVFGSALAVAILGRFLLPAVTTQVAVLGSLTGLAAAIFSGIESLVGPAAPACCIDTEPVAASPWLLVVMPAVGWLLLSLLIGLVGLRESRRPDAAAQRRASVYPLLGRARRDRPAWPWPCCVRATSATASTGASSSRGSARRPWSCSPWSCSSGHSAAAARPSWRAPRSDSSRP